MDIGEVKTTIYDDIECNLPEAYIIGNRSEYYINEYKLYGKKAPHINNIYYAFELILQEPKDMKIKEIRYDNKNFNTKFKEGLYSLKMQNSDDPSYKIKFSLKENRDYNLSMRPAIKFEIDGKEYWNIFGATMPSYLYDDALIEKIREKNEGKTIKVIK